MKSFIFSTCFFALMLSGIIFYHISLEHKADKINTITKEIESSILNRDVEKVDKKIEDLSNKFSEMQNWIMAFEDHDQILTMAQCVEGMKSYCEYFNANEILTELYKFRFLLNYSVQSVKPTIKNIL
ncbi:MAG: DUF4363 family protein [Clostridia bacterium]|nr:DUF4363 family protein [Clostridia bacterium]